MIAPPPVKTALQDDKGNVKAEWVNFFSDVFFGVLSTQTSGTTAERPNKNLFIGKTYFDTNLGYLIAIKQVKPVVIWVNGAGVAV